jgi:hypothetical protein
MGAPFTFQVAAATPFDGAEDTDGNAVTPPFVAENTRDAIIEARETAQGKARAPILLLHNGSMSNGFWHGYSELISSDQSPIPIPWDCTLTEYTFSNNRTSVDGRMDFYVNGTDPADIVYSISFSNVNRVLTDSPNFDLNAGDLLRLRWVDQGQNPRDVGSTLFFILK